MESSEVDSEEGLNLNERRRGADLLGDGWDFATEGVADLAWDSEQGDRSGPRRLMLMTEEQAPTQCLVEKHERRTKIAVVFKSSSCFFG